MTTAFDAKMYDVAGGLVATFGTTATYTVPDGATDPVASTVAAGTDHTVRTSPPQRWRHDLVDGKAVLADDLWAVLPRKDGESVSGSWADLTFTPNAPATLAYGSASYAVVAARPYRSGDDVAGWLLHLRAD